MQSHNYDTALDSPDKRCFQKSCHSHFSLLMAGLGMISRIILDFVSQFFGAKFIYFALFFTFVSYFAAAYSSLVLSTRDSLTILRQAKSSVGQQHQEVFDCTFG